MSTTEDGANLDAAEFNLDAWIDDIVRPEVIVELYPYEAEYARKVAAIEAQIPAARKAAPGDRGLNEASEEQLLAQVQELRAERSERALKVRVRQPTDTEIAEAFLAAKKAKAKQDDIELWAVAAATVHPSYDGSLAAAKIPPHFTGPQLVRLRYRDRSGESMAAQLVLATRELATGLPVPSSPAS